MLEKQWYYIEEKKQEGPISEEELKKKFFQGSLSKDTFLWSASMSDWQRAFELFDFEKIRKEKFFEEEPQISPREESYREKRSHVRPWVRYWARQIDLLFASVLFSSIMLSFSGLNTSWFPLLLLIFWIFAEALFLSTWGTTPGKFLLGITLRDANKEKLKFSQALKRSCFVWFRGMGCGLPFVQIIAMTLAYRSLELNGGTSWDLDHSWEIRHKKVGFLRVLFIICILMTILAFLLFMFFSLNSFVQESMPVLTTMNKNYV